MVIDMNLRGNDVIIFLRTKLSRKSWEIFYRRSGGILDSIVCSYMPIIDNTMWDWECLKEERALWVNIKTREFEEFEL